jgi:hypothetical protein
MTRAVGWEDFPSDTEICDGSGGHEESLPEHSHRWFSRDEEVKLEAKLVAFLARPAPESGSGFVPDELETDQRMERHTGDQHEGIGDVERTPIRAE